MTENTRNEKLESLRINPERKLPSRGGGWGKVIAVLVVVAAVAAGLQYARKDKGDQAAAAGGAGAATEQTTATQAADSRIALTATGYVTPLERVSLSPEVIGRVTWADIEKGDNVTSGQVLVRLDDRDYLARLAEAKAREEAAKARLAELEAGSRKEEIERARADVARAEASLANADRTLTRQRTLEKQGGVVSQSDIDDAQAGFDVAIAEVAAARQTLALAEIGPRKEQVDAARADYEAARAATEGARLAVEDTVIRAPLNGTILEKLIEVGELVSPQNFGGTRGARTELLSMADLGELQVEVDVNESDFAKIAMDQPGEVFLDAYPDKKYQGRIREIAPEANRQKATVQVKVKILDPDKFVRPEMSARVDLLKQ